METWNGDGFNPNLVFTFNKGVPEYLYVDVDEIWYDAFGFGDYANPQPVPEVDYQIADNVEDVKLQLTTTGHNWNSGTNNTYNTGNAAEFYEATHHVLVNGQSEYDQHLWRTCSPNPAGCQPQNGTWAYSRSGWCPGSIALVWHFDLKPFFDTQGRARLSYQFDPDYLDYCHPNHPDCVNGVTCPECAAPDNPILRVSGKVLSYSNDGTVLTQVHALKQPAPFEVQLFPNPVANRLTIRTDYDKGAVSVLILNMQGQEMTHFNMVGEHTLDVSTWAPGVYVVKLLGGTVVTRKVIKE